MLLHRRQASTWTLRGASRYPIVSEWLFALLPPGAMPAGRLMQVHLTGHIPDDGLRWKRSKNPIWRLKIRSFTKWH
jgi:hypothetical protein